MSSHIEKYLPHLADKIEQLFQIISDNEIFCIVWHSNPDGDCLGSMLWLWETLEQQGKKVQYCASRNHEPSLSSRITDIEKVQYYIDRNNTILWLDLDVDTQVIIFVDHNKSNQRSDMKEYMSEFINNKITVCIDHHVSSWPFTGLDIVDETSSSACELIWEILDYRLQHKQEFTITKNIATHLYLWLTTDTGQTVGLEYELDSIRSHENALGMLYAGANKQLIVKKLNEVTPNMIEFAKRAFGRVKHSKHCIRLRSTAVEAQELGLDGEQTKIAFRALKWLVGVKVLIRFRQADNHRYMSLRTATWYNVQEIAAQFGGWWHKVASGVKFENSWSRTEQDLEDIVQKIDDIVDKNS